MNRRAILQFTAFVLLTSTAWAGKPEIFTDLVPGTGAAGYDVVSYFSGTPSSGKDEFTAQWKGATWKFASAANRDAFVAQPEKYAPQYGGYCAYAVSKGYTAKGDPEAWSVVDGKLYLNYSLDVRKMWSEDIPGNISKGDANWPQVLQ